ncbi:LexA family transcriptional regulator [Bartonella sp. LJL80]
MGVFMGIGMFSVTTQMRKLRERAGLSMDDLARAMGYARASSIQRYENAHEFLKEYFSVDLTTKLAKALIGRGSPPIAADEVWALCMPDARARLLSGTSHAYGESLALHFGQKTASRYGEPSHVEEGVGHGSFAENGSSGMVHHSNAKITGHVDFQKNRRLPVYGQAVAGVNGEFELNGNVIFDVLCPPRLYDANDAYAVQVSGESMWPRYRDGEIVYCDPTRRVKKGDFVVAQVMMDEYATAPQAFIKMFVRHNAEELVLEQFNPAKQLTFPHARVVSVHYIALSGDSL